MDNEIIENFEKVCRKLKALREDCNDTIARIDTLSIRDNNLLGIGFSTGERNNAEHVFYYLDKISELMDIAMEKLTSKED